MAFWLILIKIAKILATIRKYAELLSAVSSGKFVQGLISQLVVGQVCNAIADAGVPIDDYNFKKRAAVLLDQIVDKAAGDLSKHGLVLAPDLLENMLSNEIKRLVLGHSVANGREAGRHIARSADPLILHSGEFERTSTDLLLRGAGIDLGWRRVYRSGAGYRGPLGRGWDHSCNLRLSQVSEDIVSVLNGDLGTRTFIRHPRFGQAGYDYFTPPNGLHDAVVPDGAGSFRLLRAQGTVWEFEPAGALQHRVRRIAAPGGSACILNYDNRDCLARIEVNGPGRWLDLGYDDQNRVVAVSDHSGRACSYEYDDLGYMSGCSQWIELAGKSYRTAEYYEYARVGESHRIARVRDEAGQVIVENTYNTARTSDSFGFVVQQTTEAGPTHFVYEHIPPDAADGLAVADRPSSRVFETMPSGHVVERILNGAGNELVRRDDYVEGHRVRTAVLRTRYNADGAIVARMDPEGGLTQFLRGRDAADPDGEWSEGPLRPDVTLHGRMAFGDELARIERSQRMSLMARTMEQADWLAALPSRWARQDPKDAIVKSTYRPGLQLVTTRSDPRHTRSPDPKHPESAPPGSPAHSPGSPAAIEHARYLTRFEYTADGLPERTKYPDRTRPALLNSPPLTGLEESVIKRDAKGRPTERRDRSGYIWHISHYPPGATPAERAREGFPKRELRPHADWRFDDAATKLLEFAWLGAWQATPQGMVSPALAGARAKLTLEGARIELWQAASGDPLPGRGDVQVIVDGVARPPWNQALEGIYVLEELDNGRHTVDLHTASPRSFGVARALVHVAFDHEVDILGRVVRTTDPMGSVSETAYDALDRAILTRSGEPGMQQELRSDFDRDGRLMRETRTWRDELDRPLGGGAVIREYEYEARGLPSRDVVRSADGLTRRAERHHYDLRGLLVATRNGRGTATRFRHDALGRRTHVIEAACSPDQAIHLTRMDLCGRPLVMRDPLGAKVINGRLAGGEVISGYDARGRLALSTDALGHLDVTQADASGRETVASRIARRDDGAYVLLHRLETRYDELGDPVELRLALLDEPVVVADPFGAPDKEYVAMRGSGLVDEAVTVHELDAFGRQVRSREPMGGIGARRLDPQGRPVEERLPSGRRVLRVYNGAGLVRRAYISEPATAPEEATQEMAWYVQDHEHDAIGRETARVDPAGNRWTTTYDSLGHVRHRQDPLGWRVEIEHDALSQEVARTEGLSVAGPGTGLTTRRAYDGAGNLVRLTDPAGRVHQFDYDGLDRLRRIRNLAVPGDAGVQNEYDKAGRLVRTVSRSGLATHHVYDAAGHRTGTWYDAALVPANEALSVHAAAQATYAYDGLGRLVAHENDWIRGTLKRESRGLVLEETVKTKPAAGLPALGWQVRQTFDVSGRRSRLVLPSGRVIGYRRDTAGRIVGVDNLLTPPAYPGSPLTAAPSELAAYSYAGEMPRLTRYPLAGVRALAWRDARGQVAERRVADEVTGALLWRSQRLLDGANHTRLETFVAAAGMKSRRHKLDGTGQLTGYADRHAMWAPLTLNAPHDLPYDPSAAPRQPLIDVFVASAAVQMAETFRYDAAGNRLQTAEPGLAGFASLSDPADRYSTVGGQAWSYDADGRLLDDGVKGFRYDGAGLVCEETGGQGAAAGLIRDATGRIILRLQDGESLWIVYADMTPVAYEGADGLVEMTPGRADSELLHVAGDGVDSWLVSDERRTPRLVSMRGALQGDDVASFRPFGALEGGQPAPGLAGYGGMLQLPGSDLLHAQNRSYRTDVGRFLQPDPAGFVDGLNLYRYARNNPIDFFDPLGLQAITKDDESIFGFLEKLARELSADQYHKNLSQSKQGTYKHLEMQFAVTVDPHMELRPDLLDRIVPEIWIDDKGIIQKLDSIPQGAGHNFRTIDIAIVKKEVAAGRLSDIVGKPAKDVIEYAIDYKSTPGSKLQERAALESLIGNRPVVKLTGKAGELTKSITRRIKYLEKLTHILSRTARVGAKKVVATSIPLIGGLFTYATAEGSQGERIAHAVAGEIGIGPFDLDMMWSGINSEAEWDEEYREEHGKPMTGWGRYSRPHGGMR